MDFRLLFPLAALSIVGFISFFVERAAIDREIKMAVEKDDELQATLRLLRRDIREVSLGGSHLFIPYFILTLLGAVPNWIVLGSWLMVALAIIRLPLVHFTRGREAAIQDKARKSFFPFVPFFFVSLTFIVSLYIYTLVATVKAL